MSKESQLTGRLIAAARGLVGVSLADFAATAGISVEALRQIERSGSTRICHESDTEALGRALKIYGVIILAESDGMGAGVRLKFTRHDARQINRLENEGGIVGSDDAL